MEILKKMKFFYHAFETYKYITVQIIESNEKFNPFKMKLRYSYLWSSSSAHQLHMKLLVLTGKMTFYYFTIITGKGQTLKTS